MTNAMRSAQINHDHKCPPEDDGREDYVSGLVDEMMRTGECDLVPFFTKTKGFAVSVDGFDVSGSECMADADTRDCELLQIVLACLNGEHEKAEKLAGYFESSLRNVAERLINSAMEKHNERD